MRGHGAHGVCGDGQATSYIISHYGQSGYVGCSVTTEREAMSKLTYRNSQGQLVDISTVAATKAKNEFGAILEQAVHGGAVAITRHDLPKAVLLSYEEFVSLVNDRAPQLDDLTTEFDGLLARMQTAKARQGMADAFSASPSQLGRAAVTAARKARRPSPKRSRRTSRARTAK